MTADQLYQNYLDAELARDKELKNQSKKIWRVLEQSRQLLKKLREKSLRPEPKNR